MNINDLTTKEKAVFDGIGEGLSAKAIGKKLGLKPQTIQTYRYRVMMKLGLKSSTEIVKAFIWEQILQISACKAGEVFAFEKGLPDIKNILGVK